MVSGAPISSQHPGLWTPRPVCLLTQPVLPVLPEQVLVSSGVSA